VFLFLLTLVFLPATAGAQIGFSVQSDGDDQLYSIDLPSGTATPIGPTGFNDIECLSFDPSGTILYGVDDNTDQLVTCSTSTGACNAVGPLVNLDDGQLNCGLTFDCSGNLFLSTEEDTPTFYSVNPNTGQATPIGPQGQDVTGLAARKGDVTCFSGVFGLGGEDDENLGCMDTTTGAFQEIGPLINVSYDGEGGIDFDSNGVLWGIEDGGTIFTINPATGLATVVTTTFNSFEGLAINADTCGTLSRPIPTLGEWGLIAMSAVLGIAGFMFIYIRRRKITA